MQSDPDGAGERIVHQPVQLLAHMTLLKELLRGYEARSMSDDGLESIASVLGFVQQVRGGPR